MSYDGSGILVRSNEVDSHQWAPNVIPISLSIPQCAVIPNSSRFLSLSFGYAGLISTLASVSANDG